MIAGARDAVFAIPISPIEPILYSEVLFIDMAAMEFALERKWVYRIRLIGVEVEASGEVGLADLSIGEAVKSTAWVDAGLGVSVEGESRSTSGEGKGMTVSPLRKDA